MRLCCVLAASCVVCSPTAAAHLRRRRLLSAGMPGLCAARQPRRSQDPTEWTDVAPSTSMSTGTEMLSCGLLWASIVLRPRCVVCGVLPDSHGASTAPEAPVGGHAWICAAHWRRRSQDPTQWKDIAVCVFRAMLWPSCVTTWKILEWMIVMFGLRVASSFIEDTHRFVCRCAIWCLTEHAGLAGSTVHAIFPTT